MSSNKVMLILSVALPLLCGCGLSDHYTSFPIPASLRYDAPAKAEGEPDYSKIVKEQGRSLFANRPDRIEISAPVFDTFTRTYVLCARTPDAAWHPTMVARIVGDNLVDRWRATPEDHCEGRDFTSVQVD